METLVVVVVALWAIRRLIVDGAFAVRGQTPPTMAHRRGGSRYGARAYLGDVWSDAWQSASSRRQARRARRAAGQPRWPRLTRAGAGLARRRDAFRSWWRSAGGSRELHRGRDDTLVDTVNPSRWDRAWTRAEERRAARTAHRPAGRQPGTSPAAGPAGPSGPTGQARPTPDTTTTRPPAGPDFPPARPNGAGPEQEPGRNPAAGPAGDQRQGGTDPGTASGRPPGAAPERDRPNESAAPTTTTREGNTMAEATGLTTAISYADAQRQAAEGNVVEVEGWIASLEAHEVTGEAIAAARQAMEQFHAAGASFAQAKSALDRHLQVKESYDANPDAGDREFVTSE